MKLFLQTEHVNIMPESDMRHVPNNVILLVPLEVCASCISWLSSLNFLFKFEVKYIEDIYSFAVNTINIVIECNENISVITSAKHE